jgi:cytochrome c oxidase accessory protein FixG
MMGFVHTEEALSRAEQRSSPLYSGRVEVYAKAVKGQIRTIKWAALTVLLAIYYVTPWIRWDRGLDAPHQAVLADIANARAYFFGIEIWPQEVYFLTGILMLAAFGLFLVTSLFGRLWCGFACPQTVWTDLYMQVERWIEGDRNERMRFDKAPWTADKAARRVAKHAAWLLIAFWTGGAWILYFNDAPSTVHAFWTGHAGLAVYGFCGLFTATTYVLAGMAREQVCTFMCPWPRIQCALVDRDTLAVTYERWRGEPPGKLKREADAAPRGDCIDCRQCVSVCPTGIDIRDGFQMECIGCGLCIDACDSVMAKIGRPPKLIAYDSERSQELRAAGKAPEYRLIRPRTVLYTTLLAVIGMVMLAVLILRPGVGLDVIPDRNPLFITLSDGSIRNGCTVRVMNKAYTAKAYRLGTDVAGGLLMLAGDAAAAPTVTVPAPPDGVGSYHIYLRPPREAVQGEVADIGLVLTDPDTGAPRRFTTLFRGPER